MFLVSLWVSWAAGTALEASVVVCGSYLMHQCLRGDIPEGSYPKTAPFLDFLSSGGFWVEERRDWLSCCQSSKVGWTVQRGGNIQTEHTHRKALAIREGKKGKPI